MGMGPLDCNVALALPPSHAHADNCNRFFWYDDYTDGGGGSFCIWTVMTGCVKCRWREGSKKHNIFCGRHLIRPTCMDSLFLPALFPNEMQRSVIDYLWRVTEGRKCMEIGRWSKRVGSPSWPLRKSPRQSGRHFSRGYTWVVFLSDLSEG